DGRRGKDERTEAPELDEEQPARRLGGLARRGAHEWRRDRRERSSGIFVDELDCTDSHTTSTEKVDGLGTSRRGVPASTLALGAGFRKSEGPVGIVATDHWPLL